MKTSKLDETEIRCTQLENNKAREKTRLGVCKKKKKACFSCLNLPKKLNLKKNKDKDLVFGFDING